jgi:enoyl-CoA hydratase/carnithine racemase
MRYVQRGKLRENNRWEIDHMDTSDVTLEDKGKILVINFKSSDKIIVSDASVMIDMWEALDQQQSHEKQIMLIRVAKDGLSPRLVDDFWMRAREAPIDHAPRRGQAMPRMVAAANASVQRILSFLTSVPTLTIMSLDGEVDFDLLGLPLACNYRVCTPETVFINNTLKRSASPGSGTPWFLNRIVGPDMAVRLYLDRTSLTAAEALDIGIVDHISDSKSIEEEGIAIAERLASCDPQAMASLLAASHLVDLDLPTYLERAGTGFERLPTA